MWSWFKRKAKSSEPTVQLRVIGEVHSVSGMLLLTDPTFMCEPVRIEGVPTGLIRVFAELIHYPEGGTRIRLVRLCVRDGEPDSRGFLGKVGVDSGTVVALDARTHDECWKEVGPDRIGRTTTPKHTETATLIGKKFGLRFREVNFICSQFLKPISEELEAEIIAYLKIFPEYADYPFMYFRIETNNTVQRINDAMDNRLWCEVSLGNKLGESLLAFTAGFGDGTYPVEGLYRGDDLLAIEVRFIGPEQDAVLEAFPILRE